MPLPTSLLRALLAILCGVLSAHTAAAGGRWAQLADTLFIHHNDPEAGSGTALVQDRTGFIWLGTQSGLVRWDGYQFRRYAADAAVPGSLPDSFILTLHIDERGRLWVGTSAGGLARYDSIRDNFVRIDGVRGGAVTAIADDGRHGLWVGAESGLQHLEPGHEDRLVPLPVSAAAGLPDGGVQAVLTDGVQLWIGTRRGLWRRPNSAVNFSPVPLGAGGEPEPAITRLFRDAEGRIWVGTHAHGAFLIEGGEPRELREGGPTPTLHTDSVLSITEAAPGEIWLGTDGGGIVAVDASSLQMRRIRHYPDTPSSLSDDFIYALYRDRSGLVWVANIGALSQHDPRQRAVLNLFGTTGRREAPSNKKVYSVSVMPDGRIWLGAGSGIDIFDAVAGRVAQFLPDPTHPDTALPKGRVQAMALGDDGTVYIATQQGLYRSDVTGRPVTRVTLNGRSATAGIRALHFEAGTLWLGGEQDGLWTVDMHAPGNPVILAHQSGTDLGDARITSIERGAGSALWVGTRSSLARVDIRTHQILRVPANSSDPTQLLDGYVASTLVDHRGRLWVASFGSGVQVLEGVSADGHWRFRRLGLRDGLPHLGVDKLLEDREGNIWVSTDNGLAVIDGTHFGIRVLQRAQGLGMRTFWTDSGASTPEGELLFGANGGLAVVQPEVLQSWTYTPPIVITAMRSGGRSLPAAQFNGAAELPVLRVAPGRRAFDVEFAALDYSAPEHNRYAYRLEGFDSDWINADANVRLASYTNLPPGSYVLRIRGSNREGTWSAPISLPVTVESAWYQTAAFKVGIAAGLLTLVGVLIQARTLYLRRRQNELQTLVNERTAELERRSDELRESQRQLELIAYSDPLTGLPNRRLFDDELKHRVALALRDGDPFTLIIVDLDGFKKINDTLGHDAGDALLMAMALRLQQAVRGADRVARLGGDEFAVILSQTSELAAVERVCKRILASLGQAVEFKDSAMRVTASLGSAQCPTQGSTTDSLYKAADTALYEAKRGGRNCWRWYGHPSGRVSTVVSEAASKMPRA